MSALLDKRVGQYVALRDKINEIEKRHVEELRPFREVMERLGMVLLGTLQETNSESVKTSQGTFYKRTVTNVSVNDPKAFRDYVLDNGAWNLADVRANKVGVQAYVSQEGAPPPGVNFSQALGIGVRRPAASGEEASDAV